MFGFCNNRRFKDRPHRGGYKLRCLLESSASPSRILFVMVSARRLLTLVPPEANVLASGERKSETYTKFHIRGGFFSPTFPGIRSCFLSRGDIRAVV